MGTNYIAPTWRMPRNANNTPVDKLSDYSIDFDTADAVVPANNPSVNLTSHTVSAWIKPNGTTGGIIKIHCNQRLWYLNVRASGIRYQIASNLDSTTPVSTTEWTHVAASIDQSVSPAVWKIYQNGVETATTTGSVTIGYWGGGSNEIGNSFDGEISQVCIFDYALTDGSGGTVDQISYLYNLNNPMVISGVKPIAYWPLGDNANPIAVAGYPNISVGADSVFDFESGSTTFIKAFDVPVTTFTECTFSAWVNFETVTGTYQYVMGMGSGPGNFMSISKNQNSGTWYTYDGTGSDYTASSPVANRWYHVVVTQTGTTRRFYIDGVEDANSPFTVQALAIPYDNLTLGCYNNSSSSTPSVLYKLDGKLSNVQVWDKKIEQTDVTTLYNDGQPLMTGTQPEEANLRAWYKLNQSANWEADSVGNWQIPDAVSAFPQCFEFDGIADKVTIPKGSITDTGSKSVSIWIKNEITSGTDYVFNSRAGGGTSLGITLIQTTTAGYIISNSHNPLHSSHIATDYQTALRIPNDGKWHHLVWTAFPTLQKLKAYIDGVFVYEYTGDTTIDTTPSTDITVGATTSPWTGKLSNFQIWDDVVLSDGGVALNDTATGQIAELFNNGTPLTTAIESSNMKVWCKFDSTAVWYPASGIWGFPSAVEPGSPIVNFSN